MTTYKCEVCKLEYSDPKTAKACQQWCSTHNSCNYQIAKQAVNKDEAKNKPVSGDERFKSYPDKFG